MQVSLFFSLFFPAILPSDVQPPLMASGGERVNFSKAVTKGGKQRLVPEGETAGWPWSASTESIFDPISSGDVLGHIIVAMHPVLTRKGRPYVSQKRPLPSGTPSGHRPDVLFKTEETMRVRIPAFPPVTPGPPQLMFSCREGSQFCPILFDLKLLYCCF